MKTAVCLFSILATLGVQIGGKNPEAPSPPPVREYGIQAIISGIEPGAVYEELPPALVELSNLPAGTAVWVEIRSADGDRASTVDAHFMPNPNGEALLPLGGLASQFDRDGEWTVLVLTNSSGGAHTPLARTTFQLQRTR